MSNQPGNTKHRCVRNYLACGAYLVTLLVCMFMVIGSQESESRDGEVLELAAWRAPNAGEAASLVVAALVGVILIARR